LVLRLRAGTSESEVWVFYAGCTGNGFIDASGARELTAAGCRPLFAAPVLPFTGLSEQAFGRCSTGP
ncbi:MAG: hypothetical protein WAS07_09335, partial [Micropruina sp.]